MALPTPVVERITQHIETTLKGVRKSRDYSHDLTVERVKRKGNTPIAGQTLAVIVQGQPTPLPETSHDQTGWRQSYMIDAFIDPDEGLTQPLDAAINLLRADIEKALTYERTSYTRGGLAERTLLDSPRLFQRQPGGQFGVQVRVIVEYLTVFNDPYTSIYSINQ